jgi:hypothetical protein
LDPLLKAGGRRQRAVQAIKQVDGKRLRYRESVDNQPYFVPASPVQADAPFDWRASYRPEKSE